MLIYVIDLTEEYLKKQDQTILDLLVYKMNCQFGTGNFIISPYRGTFITREAANVTNLNFCKDLTSELNLKSFQNYDSETTSKEFGKKIKDDGEYNVQIEKLYNGEIDKIDFDFDYNYEEGEPLHRLHFILQKEIIDEDIYFIGGIQDITEEQKHEQELININNALNLLIKESNHRIKNNLSILLKSISLEKRVNKNNLEEIIEKIEIIESMVIFHSLLYKGPTSKEVFILEYFIDFAEKTKDVYPASKEINYKIDTEKDFKVSADKIMPLSLIVNELITNTAKYAFENYEVENKEIYSSINKKDNICEIIYRNNGKGLDEDFNPKQTSGLGWIIINSLVEQLNGDYKVYNNNGMCFELIFPLN